MVSVHSCNATAPVPQVSVVIPAIDESETLGQVIDAIQSEEIVFEIIVVDGESCDDTAAVARHAGARVISSSVRQRAHQLNLGARHARGDILLFVHADTILPRDGLDQIIHALQDPNVVGGAFARKYASRSVFLAATCVLAGWRNRVIGWHLGDQAMFARRTIFFQLGGFREVEMFEDVNFSRRLKKLGALVTLVPGVTSSSRRFERQGPALITLRDLGLTIRYLAHGLPPEGRAPARPETCRSTSLRKPDVRARSVPASL